MSGQQICLCGGGNADRLGEYLECENTNVCVNKMLFVRSCGEDIQSYWIRLNSTAYSCLRPYDGPTSTPYERELASCGHLEEESCSPGSPDRCPHITCPSEDVVLEELWEEAWNGTRHLLGRCRKCRNPN